MRYVSVLPLLALLVACAGGPGQRAATPATFSDPFAYCAAVGTIDAPDHRYVGPRMPAVIALGLKQAVGAPAEAPLSVFVRNSYWRCMQGKVYACTVGANIPCLEKADLGRKPSPGMVAYCAAHPTAAVIPAAVTGRATVYLWRCHSGRPAVVRQVNEPDARGFLARFWYEIQP